MSNGFSVEQMIEMILEEVRDTNRKVDKVQAEISSVNANGCARYSIHDVRLRVLEKWKDRFLVGCICVLVAGVGGLITIMAGLIKIGG